MMLTRTLVTVGENRLVTIVSEKKKTDKGSIACGNSQECDW